MLMITGARGWEHKQWLGSYYPNEIAIDWHLTFYSKEFQTALAPVNLWSSNTLEAIREFSSDVNERYPLIFEQNEDENDTNILQLQTKMDEFVANWVVFREQDWQLKTSLYHIKRGEIIRSKNLAKNAAVFNVYSDEILKDVVIKEIMATIKKEFKQFDVVYCFFDGELVSIDILNTAKTLQRMLALD